MATITRGRLLANRLRRTITGPMWHGPAVMELLRTVSAEEAHVRPIESAHTVWELVVHMTAWATIARDRLDGKALDYPSESVDWPGQPAAPSKSAWTSACQKLADSYEALAAATKLLDDAALDAMVKNNDYSVDAMLAGVIEHGVYHGGQIAVLLKAVRTNSPHSSHAS